MRKEQSTAYDQFRGVRFFGSLDGLRAASILGVIWFHTWYGTTYFDALQRIPVLREGFFGVDVFFAISGFLITTLLLREREKDGKISLRDFYVRRGLRIWPLYYAMLGLYVVLVLLVEHHTDRGRAFFHFLPSYLTYTYTWFGPGSGQPGAIFNFALLASELSDLGWAFRTRCDTEVLLAAYAQWGQDWYEDAKQASADISQALGLQDDDPTAFFLVGGASHFMARHRASVGLLERAIELNPNLAMAHGLLAISYASVGRPIDGLAHIERALRLSPRDPMTYLFFAGQALCRFVSDDFLGAIASAERGISINPSSSDNHLYMAAALAELDQTERAKEQIRRGLRFMPRLNLLVIGRAVEGGNSGWARYHDALRKAGLPE